MKPSLFVLAMLLIVSCSKTAEPDVSLSPTDAVASAGIVTELNNLAVAAPNLQAAATTLVRHHWDSAFHHHDSLQWVHHRHYNTPNNHPHNDHHHRWVPYDPAGNHAHHYHPVQRGHGNDSIVVPNNHHTSHQTFHPGVQGLHDHHLVNSLHHIHRLFHP